ncbi:MAG: diguanylate cyclase [Sulfurimonadaceae bacterium]|nr:diguanylate cyclase [Sulfurimonadaceae bacterium]
MSERILLVEDNKSLSKLVKLKLEKELDFEVDVAYTMAEAELFSRKYDYFIAILDLNLPDAPNGEIVDRMIEKKVPSIVLTGTVDKAFRAEILKKDIIDYIAKGGIEDIDYIVETIDRLSKNRNYKVMVVDDSMMFRKQMKKMVQSLFFDTIAVAHGEEALMMLKENPDIRMVITDYNMPVMNGLELTKEIRKTHPKSQLSIFILSSTDDADTSAMFLKKGATDYIKKPYSKEELSCRLNNAIEALENIDKITNFTTRDILTGLYNRRRFYEKAESYFEYAMANEERFATAVIDIDGCKGIHDTYGIDVSEQVISDVADILRSNVQAKDIVARLDGDEFAVLLKDITSEQAEQTLERIRYLASVATITLPDSTEFNYTVSIGAVIDSEGSLNETLNEADMQLYEAKQQGKNRVSIS